MSAIFLVTGGWDSVTAGEDPNWAGIVRQAESFVSDVEVHGFLEGRGGFRLLEDKYEKDMSVMETRLQLDLSAFPEWGNLKFKGDTLGDFVTGDTHFDIREANFACSPLEFVDAKIGRQVLTWGTGDLLFINDLFPKDWQSFLIGRDSEYLKAPSDAAKLSFFSDWANLDFVYTPRFDHDRFINGERISFFNDGLGRISGEDAVVHTDKPNRWFGDDELAMRIYRNIENYELALYGYRGYWKSPGGMNLRGQAIFPDLNVYGGSIRGALGKGIGNFEVGYYESDDDQNGSDPMVKNSELRFLTGYTQELAKELTGSIQYYVEQMTDYDNYRDSLPAGAKSRDRSRHLITVRLTQLLLNQNLRVGIFGYFSPTDQDSYLRPNVHYKISDDLAVEAGANVFLGEYNHTFFGQFHDNTNIYTSVRYNF
ncbi:MAG: hypothetical protein JXD22_10155 [Sedimentisphaerales bacterium]|nr:hypothetical protein [Sedimentisphaerales bacterium]